MNEYYVFPTKAEAEACMNFINGSSWFPITPNKKGVPNPNAKKVLRWAGPKALKELVSGEWAVPRVPVYELDRFNVPQSERDSFLSAYGSDIRTLTRADFKPVWTGTREYSQRAFPQREFMHGY
jgi:hypothetical protein